MGANPEAAAIADREALAMNHQRKKPPPFASYGPPPLSKDDLGIWDASTIDPAAIPPRGWLLGTSFCRQFLSSLIADGGVGKTSLRVAQALAMVTGRSDITDEHVFVPGIRFLFVSLEDNKDEINRRIAAAMIHHKISPEEVRGRLFVTALKRKKLFHLEGGSIEAGELQEWLDAAIAAYQPDAVDFDPLIKAHALSENDNAMMDIVCEHLADVADTENIAVDLPHHSRKGGATPGDADRGRGASSIKDATRITDTLTPMSEDEARQFGISPHERTSYVRFDSGKYNLCPARQAKWFRLVNVPIGNPTATYPKGDHVQTVEVWRPPSLWEGADSPTLNRILDRIDAGLPSGSRYSQGAAATDRAAWKVVAEEIPSKTEEQAREIINIWVKNELLVSEDYTDPVIRKPRKGLRVDATKRPS
jgi:hypothetical protein